MMKYYIHTYGCQMNVHESEKLAGEMQKINIMEAESAKDADIIIFNTCAIRESAEQKIVGNIGDIKPLKQKDKNKIVVVCGCMTQQNGVAEKLKEKFPFIDIIFGTLNIEKFKEFLQEKIDNNKGNIEIADMPDIKKRDNMDIYRTSGVNAWVNISYGCNNFCTYCIVPYVRGREVSREMPVIVSEVQGLVKRGYKQITLLGQNVNSFGNDIADGKSTFANLLRELDKIEGEFWIRFMSSHPKDISDEVLDVMANSKHICHGLHLPIQSGSNRILEKMNRKYTTDKYLGIIERARQKMPDIEFTTDIIVGFPGETDEDFEDTVSLVKNVKYQNIFTFIYSRRKGTVADKLPDQIDLKTKKERIAKLIDIEREIATEISEKYVGTVHKVLVEDISPKKKGTLIGSLECGKAISFEGTVDLIGKFVNVKVLSSKLTALFGEIED